MFSTRHAVAELLEKGLTRVEVSRQLGIARSTVSYHARRLGQPIDERFAKRVDWAEVQRLYDTGLSLREVAAIVSFSRESWHKAVRRGDIVPRPSGRPLDEACAADTHRNRGHLKRKLVKAGIKEDRCEICGLREWRGEPLSIALHHINGDGRDNRILNLQLLCPNCHSQTETFAGRNRKRARREPADEAPTPRRPEAARTGG